jgi:hypothetical protein
VTTAIIGAIFCAVTVGLYVTNSAISFAVAAILFGSSMFASFVGLFKVSYKYSSVETSTSLADAGFSLFLIGLGIFNSVIALFVR